MWAVLLLCCLALRPVAVVGVGAAAAMVAVNLGLYSGDISLQLDAEVLIISFL